jgi:hypothetical protein
MGSFDVIARAFENIAAVAEWRIVGALVAAGVVAMAILQVIKELTPIRRAFQRQWVGRWIAARCEGFNKNPGVQSIGPGGAETDLIDLATGGDDRAFFDLAAEQLIAQMNAAAQAALDYPGKHRDLLAMISEGVEVADIEAVLAYVPRAEESPPQEYLDARNRVGNRIQRNLDGMQISLSSRWQFWMQGAALLITVIIIEVAIVGAGSATFGAMVLGVPIGIVGGYIAPVARDLVAALRSLRGA